MGVVLRDLFKNFQRPNTLRDRIAKLISILVWGLTHNPSDAAPRGVMDQIVDGLRQSSDASELLLELAARLEHEPFEGDV
jgi:hypothetical protein